MFWFTKKERENIKKQAAEQLALEIWRDIDVEKIKKRIEADVVQYVILSIRESDYFETHSYDPHYGYSYKLTSEVVDKIKNTCVSIVIENHRNKVLDAMNEEEITALVEAGIKEKVKESLLK